MNAAATPFADYGWVGFYPGQADPYLTIPVVGYFIETESSHCCGTWPLEAGRTLLSFWLGADGIPEGMEL